MHTALPMELLRTHGLQLLTHILIVVVLLRPCRKVLVGVAISRGHSSDLSIRNSVLCYSQYKVGRSCNTQY